MGIMDRLRGKGDEMRQQADKMAGGRKHRRGRHAKRDEESSPQEQARRAVDEARERFDDRDRGQDR